MSRKIAVILIAQTALIIVLFWTLVFYGKDEYESYTRKQGDQIENPMHVSNAGGATVVTLSTESQAQSGINSSTLKTGTQQTVLSTYGSVLAIDTLTDLRTRYLAAAAEANIVRASLAANREEYQRLQQLNQDNRNISDRAVRAAEAAWKVDEAKVAGAQTMAGNIRDSMRQQWGETLATMATAQSASPALQRLLQYREVLLQITLPFDAPTPRPGSKLMVTPVSGSNAKPLQAEFVSASPQTDAATQGKTYYYRAAADELRAGMRVSVRLADSAKSTTGVIVPGNAVVWYGGKTWVYRKQGADQFVRVPVSTDTESTGGWFNTANLKAGDRVVTSGAQLLLSEEFKYQIKNENQD